MVRSIALFLVIAASFAHTQTPNPTESELQHRLVGNYLTLRTPYAGNKLNFDSNGSVKGRPQHGLRSIDGFIRVESVELQDAAIVIKAQRILMTYDPKAGTLASGGLTLPVRIQIEVPSATPQNIAEVLSKIFFSAAEVDARVCSADEKLDFQTMASRATLNARKKTKNDEPQHEAHSYCFPTGDKAFAIGKDILPPKPIRAPDPEYGSSASNARVHGTSTFLLAIGPDGLPTDAILVQAADPRLNYKAIVALREWAFRPAVRDGAPVPVIITVDINFEAN